MSTLELVMTTAVTLPLAVLMLTVGIQISRYVFRLIDGWCALPGW